VCQDEGRGKRHPGTALTGGGLCLAQQCLLQDIYNSPQVDHPFIVNLRYAFQDDENCFFVLDLMLGGDLRCRCRADTCIPFIPNFSGLAVHLERLGSLPEDTVKFYVAEIASALAFLHQNRIMHRSVLYSHFYSHHLRYVLHRDLKPDNILLDERGHAHLTDFNIAVHFSERRMLTGVAGSMAYMAPEILTKRGYTYSIDWWSLGVCAYELIFGRRPFRGKTNSDLTHSIAKDQLKFPEDCEKKCSRQGMMALKAVSSFFIVRSWLCLSDAASDLHSWILINRLSSFSNENPRSV
jgi:serine/threonine kinase 32